MKAKKLSAKDLMIGDWVNYRGICKRIAPADFCHFEWIDEIRPILLTSEILEKNGFKVTRNMSSSGNKDVWSLRVSKDKVFHIIEHHNKRQFPYFWIELGSNSDIKYVHQLQHALRLCGIEKEIIL